MAAIIYGSSLYGMMEMKDLLFFPQGRARVRMRPNAFINVYIKTDEGIRGFTVKAEGDYWRPCHELGINKRQNK